MTTPKILMVEDNKSDMDTFHATIDRYMAEKGREFIVKDASTLEEALNSLNNSFDGAIIDLRLNGDSNAGNQIIEKIVEKYRIPVVVFTGTPDNVEQNSYVFKYKKGEIQYDVILDKLHEIYQTGITKVFGGRGYLEETLNKVFWKNILPHLDTWKAYNVNGKETEQALLRYTISHIIEALEVEAESYYREEMYICPPFSKHIKTGSIVKKTASGEYYIVLNPACDLAIRGGHPKTDRIMICSIEKINMSLYANAKKDSQLVINQSESEEIRNMKGNKKTKAENMVNQFQGNSYCLYYHYLPNTVFFPGGFVNFRKIETFVPDDFSKYFEKPSVQIATAFLKDIVSRFSAYYARQGQPDFAN